MGGGQQPSCPSWLLDQECGGRGWGVREAGSGHKGPRCSQQTCFLGLSPCSAGADPTPSQPGTRASLLVGPEDPATIRGNPQPEQRGGPSLLVVLVRSYSLTAVWLGSQKRRPVRGLLTGAKGKGPSRLQGLQPPDDPAPQWAWTRSHARNMLSRGVL